jgi:CHAD domain-containing protein
VSYQLEEKQKLRRQFKKICRKMLNKAIKELARRSSATRGQGVHNARKRLKQLRGMLKLMQFGLAKQAYKRQTKIFRDAAKPLSEVRDADVMIETLDRLCEHFSSQIKRKSFKKLRQALLNRRTKLRKQLLGKQRQMQKVSAKLRKEEDSLTKWTSVPNDSKVIFQGLEKTYSRAQDEMKDAIADQEDEKLHEWRKDVKYLRYQLELLCEVWPPVISPMADQTHQLADLLGEDHDLVVLKDLILNDFTDCCKSNEKELIVALLNQRRLQLEAEAIALGKKFFAESPKQFTRRLKGYWKSWKPQQNGTVAA